MSMSPGTRHTDVLPMSDYKSPRERPTPAAKQKAQAFIDALARKHGVDPYWTERRNTHEP